MKFNKLFNIFDEAILILILQNSSAKISGALLKSLKKDYKVHLINKAIINHSSNSPLLNNKLLEIETFKLQSIYIILKLIYEDKHIAMKERFMLFFEKDLHIEKEIELFWKQFDINNISNVILEIFGRLQTHIKNIEII